MKTFFDFLNSKDREALLNNATLKSYQDGELVLKRGDSNTAVYIIERGEARVMSHILDYDLEVDHLGKDDIIGEMSFVDAEPTSADVIADGDLSIRIIDSKEIENLVRHDPLFYGRFYHAIARTLSHRMRAEKTRADQFIEDTVT